VTVGLDVSRVRAVEAREDAKRYQAGNESNSEHGVSIDNVHD